MVNPDRLARAALIVLLAATASSCAGSSSGDGRGGGGAAPPAAPPPAPPVVFPRYDEVYGTATHNSYWINRNRFLDPFAGGAQELFSDQLLHERVRALEFDLHTDDARPGAWRVYHTDRPDFSQIETLADLLDQLRNFHYALPEHEVVNVILELKNVHIDWASFPASVKNFGPSHPIDELDRQIRAALGPALYEPRHFLARGAPGATMRDCAAAAGWPTIDELRGRFIVNLAGYWSNAAHDWARYAGEGDIALRACFPMRSIFDAQGDGIYGAWPGNVFDHVPPDWLARARDASIFWQVEHLDYHEVPRFLAEHGIVRGAEALDHASEEDRVRRGHQLIQTDHAWHVAQDAGPPGSGLPVDPSRRFRDPAWARGGAPIDPRALVEPGLRIYARGDAAPTFAYSRAPAGGVRRWETIVSTTRIGDPWPVTSPGFPRPAREGGVGGLRAAAGRADFIEVLRVKTGHSFDGPDQERLSVRAGIARGGVYRAIDVPASPYRTDVVGNMLALEIDDRGPADCIARAYAAGRLTAAGVPDWRLLAEERFPRSLFAQGLVFTENVLFVRTTVDGRPATLCDLASIDVPGGGFAAQLVDLSHPAPAQTCAPAPDPLP